MNRYESAKELYAKFGIDTEDALKKLGDITVSIHCWQGDDVGGFDSDDALSGGIQTTGNYPGKARNPEELMADIDKAFSLIPGKSDKYLMCALEDNISMMFHRDSDINLAFVEVKLLGSSTKDAYTDLTAEICNILKDEADVDGSNCYVKFEEVKYWGMNGFMF